MRARALPEGGRERGPVPLGGGCRDVAGGGSREEEEKGGGEAVRRRRRHARGQRRRGGGAAMSDASSDLGGARPGAVERDIEQVSRFPILRLARLGNAEEIPAVGVFLVSGPRVAGKASLDGRCICFAFVRFRAAAEFCYRSSSSACPPRRNQNFGESGASALLLPASRVLWWKPI